MNTRDEARERLKRIIDPEAFAEMSMQKLVLMADRQKSAAQKADAILALISPEGDGSEGRGDAPSLRESLPPELEDDVALVKQHYPGDWKPDDYGLYVWAPSLKGGDCTPVEVRGWGYLTGHGHGALRLEYEQAKAVQMAVSRVVAAGVNVLLSTGNRKDGASPKTTDKGGE